MIYPSIIKAIKDSKKILLTAHINPDGDALGSVLALHKALKSAGKATFPVIDDDFPTLYKFLDGWDEILKFGDQILEESKDEIDLIIALDCGDVERFGRVSEYFDGKKVINIDHHISNTAFGTLNMIDSNAASTGEMVYQIISIMGLEITKEIAEAIYTAIVTDTGQFRYTNTTSVTHQIAGDMINNGVDTAYMYEQIYQNTSKEKMLLSAKALSSLKLYFDDRVAVLRVTIDDIQKSGATGADTEGIINFGRDISTVEVAVLLKEHEKEKIKIGLRSKKYVDVATISQEIGGGGHVRAAGCTIYGNIDEAESIMIEKIGKLLK